MATPVFACGMECGIIHATAAHWITQNGVATFSTSTVRSGSRSLRCNAAGAAVSVVTPVFTLTDMVVRIYVYFATTLPNIDTVLMTGGTASLSIRFRQSTSTLHCHDGSAFAGAGVTVTTGQWYRVDFAFNDTANTLDAMVDGAALTQATVAATAQGRIQIGVTGAVTADVFFDDLLMSQTLADYPLGPGYIHHFVPTADGTHNVAGTGDFQRTLTGTDILNATTTAYQLIDDVPLDSGAGTDWINMLAPVNATDYVECVFGPAPGISTPTTGPRAVEVIGGFHQAATTTGNMRVELYSGSSHAAFSAPLISRTAVAGVTTIAYARQQEYVPQLVSSAVPWVIGGGGTDDFTTIHVRFGSPGTLDVVPDQYLDSVMIEAEFPSTFTVVQEVTAVLTTTGATSIAGTFPSTPTVDNTMIAVHFTRSATSSPPSGWADDAEVINATEEDHCVIYHRLVQSGDSAGPYTFGQAPSPDAGCLYMVEVNGLVTPGVAGSATTGRTINMVSISSGTTGTLSATPGFAVAAGAIRGTIGAVTWSNSFDDRASLHSDVSVGAIASLEVAVKEVSVSTAVESTVTWGDPLWTAMGVIVVFGNGFEQPEPPAGPTSPYVVDTFTGTADTLLTAHTPDIGGAWVQHPVDPDSSLEISDHNDARITTANFVGLVYNNQALPSAEYTIEVDMIYHSGTAANNYVWQLLGRCSDSVETFYSAGYDGEGNGGAGVWTLHKAVASSFTGLASQNVTLTTGTYRLRLEITNAQKRFYVNDVLLLSSADNTITATGFAGFYVHYVSDQAAMHLDNFWVGDVSNYPFLPRRQRRRHWEHLIRR